MRILAAVAFLLALGSGRYLPGLVISEIMYHPRGDDPRLQYVEIHNETNDPLDITGYRFTRGVSFSVEERTFLLGHEYLVIAADAERIRSEYGIENVVGNWNPATSLDNGGEVIEISNAVGVVQARVHYNDRGKWPGGADGTGHSLEIKDVYDEQDDPDSWSISALPGGSPGAANDTETGALPLVINEALLFTAPSERFVEIYNKGLEEIDISGFHVTTDRDRLDAGTLPSDLKIAGRAFVSFKLAELSLDVTPDEQGRVFIALATPGSDRVVDGHVFKPRLEGYSESRIPDGKRDFQDAATPTPAAPNRVDVVQDIVINEIFYHHYTEDPEKEFLELYNRGEETIDLGNWSFSEGIRYVIPPGVQLAAGEYLVIAANPAYIVETYGLPPARVLGPETEEAREAFGGLSNGGERVTLLDTLGRVADTVRYYDGGDWPRWADGGGSSMELIDPFQDNAVAQAWDSSIESEKSEAHEYEYEGTYSAGEQELHFLLNDAGITDVDDIHIGTRATTLEELKVFFDYGGTWTFLRAREAPPADWFQPGFDTAGWETGPGPVGYSRSFERDIEAGTFTGTFIDDMDENYTTLYLRQVVTLDSLDDLELLLLQVNYDDGFVLYINGVEVYSKNVEDRAWNAEATGSAPSAPEQIDLTEMAGNLLKPGQNLFAFQLQNTTISSNDCFLDMRMINGRYVVGDGPNLLQDGTFDEDDAQGAPRWPASSTNRYWVFEGTHVRSGRTTSEPISGTGSLRIIASGRGDNKVNRIETRNAGLSGLAARENYVVRFKARWIAGSVNLLTHGAYSSSQAPSYASSTRLIIPEALGTPGAINSVTRRQIERSGSSNAGPVIWKVRQDPAVPAPDQDVLIRARIHDADGIGAASIRYTLGQSPVEEDDPANLTVPMSDPDGDGVWEGSIPGQVEKRLILYWIVAEDSEGRSGRYPTDPIERTNPLLLDPTSPRPGDRPFLIYRAERVVDSPRLNYRFWMHKADEGYLGSRRLLSNDLVGGSFAFDDRQIYYQSRARFSGSPWARQAWQESWRVRLPDDNPMWGRVGKFNMEDHQGGGARVARERVSHYLIRFNQDERTTRVPYSIQWLADWQVNDRVVGQVREHVETPSRELLGRWFPGDSDGPFFEMDDRHDISDAGSRSNSTDGKLMYPPYGSTAFGDDKEYYRYFFGSRGGNPLDNFTDLTAFAKILSPSMTGNDVFDEEIWNVADVDAFLRNWAIRLNTGDWDQWSGDRGKNCYLYRPPIEGRWHLVPWDMELTYESGRRTAFTPPALSAASQPDYAINGKFPEVRRWINRPRVKRRFYSILRRMVGPDGQFSSQFLRPYTSLLSRIGMTNISEIETFVDQRRSTLLNATRGVSLERVAFEITTNGGEPFETLDPLVLIEGRAPVEVETIRVLIDEEEPELNAEARFADDQVIVWRYANALDPGTHSLTFIAYGFDDEEIASESIEVTLSGSRFVRGDTNLSGRVDVGDAIQTLRYIGGMAFPGCEDAMDIDDSGVIDITDAVVTITYLFLEGSPPPPPYPTAGDDPTDDALGCEENL